MMNESGWGGGQGRLYEALSPLPWLYASAHYCQSLPAVFLVFSYARNHELDTQLPVAKGLPGLTSARRRADRGQLS
jgi:hypothetical protein